MPEEATLEGTEQEIAEGTQPDESIVDKDTSVSVTESELNEAQAKTLADILRRNKEADQTGEPLNLTDEELDLYDKYTEGKLKPAEEKSEDDKSEKESKEEKEEKSEPEVSKEIQDALKLTGAKNEKDLLKKVKDLTNNIANKSKDAEYVSKISKEHQEYQTKIKNETSLWEGVKAGDKTAIEYAEKVYGVIPKSMTQTKKETSEDGAGDFELNTDAFLDEETGKKLNSFIGNMEKKVTDLESKLNEANKKLETTEKQSQKAQHEADMSRANRELLNEVVGMAKEFEDLKGIPDLEDKIHRLLSGEDLGELYDNTIGKVLKETKAAKKRGERLTLKTAFKLLKAEDSELLIQKAESKGRQSAYKEHQASKNLSELQKGGEPEQFRNYTDDEINGFVDDPETIPDSFYDEDFNPLPKEKLPKKAWKLFKYR